MGDPLPIDMRLAREITTSLRENAIRSDAWLSPSGKLFPLGGWPDTHAAFAIDHSDAVEDGKPSATGLSHNDLFDIASDNGVDMDVEAWQCEALLWKKWARIKKGSDRIYVQTYTGLTNPQRRFLLDVEDSLPITLDTGFGNSRRETPFTI